MNTKIINISGTVLFVLLVIINFDTVTSIKCYNCKTSKNGDCWNSPEDKYLIECGDKNPEITTEVSDITPETTINDGETTISEPDFTAITGTTLSSQATSSSAATTQATSSIEISSTIPSSSTTTLTTPTSTSAGTPSSTQTISSSTSTGTPSNTQTTSSSTSSNTTSITQTTSSSTSSNTPSSTRTTSSSTSTSTQSGTQATSSSTSASTSSTIQVASFEKIPFSLGSAKYLRRKREIQYRDDETGHQCAKLVYKEGEKEVVERKCMPKATKAPCEKEQYNHTEVTVCEICDNEDGCNTSSNISFGLVSMIVPIIIVLYMSL